MAYSRRKFMRHAITAAGVAAFGLVGYSSFLKPTPSRIVTPTATSTAQQNVGSAPVSYVDVHAHLQGKYRGGTDYEGAAENALAIMESLAIRKTLIMAPPQPSNLPGGTFDYVEFADVTRKYSERFGFLGGGGILNPLIQESVESGMTIAENVFEQLASDILHDGAVGFGELTAEHLSFAEDHPYESAPPDNPLFLLLADIAARHDVPIDIHMEAVAQDMPLPPRLRSPLNPSVLRENIKAFERLLSHNRKARIVWAHLGWDSTGHRTIALTRALLEAHPNLYMNIKIIDNGPQANRPLGPNGDILPEWVDLTSSFPDRFLIGSDQFYMTPKRPTRSPSGSQGPRTFLNQLPADLAPKIAYENAVRIYRLN